MIIAFGHRKQVGKDLAAELLRQNLNVRFPNKVIIKMAFADPLYFIANLLYGWAGQQSKAFYDKWPLEKEITLPKIGMTPREILIKIGTPAIREQVYQDTWVKIVEKQEADIKIISDMRFPNEFKMVKEAGGICIRLDRGEPSDDIADTALNVGTWDHVIENNGTIRELNDKVMACLIDLK